MEFTGASPLRRVEQGRARTLILNDGTRYTGWSEPVSDELLVELVVRHGQRYRSIVSINQFDVGRPGPAVEEDVVRLRNQIGSPVWCSNSDRSSPSRPVNRRPSTYPST